MYLECFKLSQHELIMQLTQTKLHLNMTKVPFNHYAESELKHLYLIGLVIIHKELELWAETNHNTDLLCQ